MHQIHDALHAVEATTAQLHEANCALARARAARNRAIAYAHKSGIRQTALAEMLGVSQTRIYQCIAAARDEEQEFDLATALDELLAESTKEGAAS